MAMHPKEMLQRYDLAPRKSLGQNFLYDDNVLARIVAAAQLQPTDQVLEIGPGLGHLTRQLARAAAAVVAVELDQRLIPVLQQELAAFSNVTLVHGDILAHHPADWFAGSYLVVANVPYYITGAILRHLLARPPRPRRLVLTVQKEVAERLAAEPPTMSLLAVSVQFYGQVSRVADIQAGSFWPTPRVDSTVVRVELSPPAEPVDDALFFRLARAAFAQRRKQLQKNLRRLGLTRTASAEIVAAAGIDGRRRAETLTMSEWRALTRAYAAHLGRSDGPAQGLASSRA